MSKKNQASKTEQPEVKPADPIVEENTVSQESVNPTEDHVVVEDPHKPLYSSNEPEPFTEDEAKATETLLTPTEEPTPPTEPDPEVEEQPATEEEESNEKDVPLFISDNLVMPENIIAGQQFVVGLNKKLEIGTKIKSGTKTFVVHWANEAHKSELDHRRKAYQTLLSLQSTSERSIKSADYFGEKAEFHIA